MAVFLTTLAWNSKKEVRAKQLYILSVLGVEWRGKLLRPTTHSFEWWGVEQGAAASVRQVYGGDRLSKAKKKL